jgi:orotate phosphoribosyltransferase
MKLKLEGARADLLGTIPASRGHYLYETGQHGDLWLDLDELFMDTGRMHRSALELARQASGTQPDLVCGPVRGGAFLAQMIAEELGAGFIFSDRRVFGPGKVEYLIPGRVRDKIKGQRVLLADDAVNAGSALLSTLNELEAGRTVLAGITVLMTLSGVARRGADEQEVPLYQLASTTCRIWNVDDCPLCESGMDLANPLNL